MIFPYMLSPLFVAKANRRSGRWTTAVNGGHRVVALFGQKPVKEPEKPEPDNDGRRGRKQRFKPKDLYQVGTAVQVVRMQRTPDNKLQVLVNGIAPRGSRGDWFRPRRIRWQRVRVLDGWAGKRQTSWRRFPRT